MLYDGFYHETSIRNIWLHKDWDNCEGYVLRFADKVGYGEFKHKFAKFVRKNHIQTVKHWMHGQRIEPNVMRKNNGN